MSERIRVLIVDDSAFMRGAVARLLSSDARFEVVGQAQDGDEGVRLAEELRPSVVTMDYNMPSMNGAQATRAILARHPIPIVMLSAHTTEGASETVEALAAGAVDFVAKPDGEVSVNLTGIRDELASKLVTAAGANLTGAKQPEADAPGSEPAASRRVLSSVSRPMPTGLRVVVIASSTGGPAALVQLLPTLRVASSAAVVLVQHMPAGFTAPLAEQLSESATFPIREAEAGDPLEAGVGLVAPGGKHLAIDGRGRIALSEAPPVHGVRPAADVTLKAVAQGYGARAVGVVLTGMGRDGALGLAAVKAAGGRTVAQDRATSTVYGMPKAAAEMGVVEKIVPLYQVGRVVTKLVQ